MKRKLGNEKLVFSTLKIRFPKLDRLRSHNLYMIKNEFVFSWARILGNRSF
jgi:hypothetical protein